jgi:hypothetical protein
MEEKAMKTEGASRVKKVGGGVFWGSRPAPAKLRSIGGFARRCSNRVWFVG